MNRGFLKILNENGRREGEYCLMIKYDKRTRNNIKK